MALSGLDQGGQSWELALSRLGVCHMAVLKRQLVEQESFVCY